MAKSLKSHLSDLLTKYNPISIYINWRIESRKNLWKVEKVEFFEKHIDQNLLDKSKVIEKLIEEYMKNK